MRERTHEVRWAWVGMDGMERKGRGVGEWRPTMEVEVILVRVHGA